MIKSSLARSVGSPITKSSQQALQADGLTPLAVVGETRLILSRADKHLALDALVVDDLDVDVLLWDEDLTSRFKSAQDFQSNHKAVVLPRPSDTLWIVTDGPLPREASEPHCTFHVPISST